MKSLLLVRHAKSSWEHYNEDFERPLNNRGHKNAPEMAKRLLDKKIKIDQFVSSPANRAFTTAQYFAEAYSQKHKDIITIPSLYHAGTSVFYNVISELNNDIDSAAIFSHNPGITDFVNGLTETRLDNMPTCAVFAVNIHTKDWKEFENAKKEFWFFDFPKSGG